MSDPTKDQDDKNKIASLRNEIAQLKQENQLLREKLGMIEVNPGKKENSVSPAIPGIHNYSSPEKKIDLFQSLFRGREEVYALRWENKKGLSGYSPSCENEWKPGVCGKPKIKCGECSHQKFRPFNKKAIENHLTGNQIIGIYPLMPDDTCYFLAIDFDKKEWEKDVLAIKQTCRSFEIPIAIERSRSGKGAHAWFFFEERLSAETARRFGTALLTFTMNHRHELPFDSYDRLFPNQDKLPKGGFGNLIALPLQKSARKQSNSVFVDEALNPYVDQWQFLANVKKLTEEDIYRFTRILCNHENELGSLRQEEEENKKPWVKKNSKTKLTKNDFPDEITIVKADRIYISKAGISSRALNALKRFASFQNPQFHKVQAMRLPIYNKPRVISCAEETEEYLCLPRGCEKEVDGIMKGFSIEIKIKNRRNSGKKIDVEFNGRLRPEQENAFNALNKFSDGILSAPPAFGKTVLAARLIAGRKRNTLILVHRKQLQDQWIDRLQTFLNLEKGYIGTLGGGKNRMSGKIDVALMQSMYNNGVVRDEIRHYGMIIIDECHHIPAFSFEQILKVANARYIYGLTATPARQDGHHPIIFMYCGPVRYEVDIRKQTKERPFNHFMTPRFTDFFASTPMDISQFNATEITIQEIYNRIAIDEKRNRLIADDVIRNHQRGRNGLVLTERTEHVHRLSDMIREQVPDVISLTGMQSDKDLEGLLSKIKRTPDGEQLTLIATGKYIGEGFDESRLDTLFLAMPVSWKGTLQQYTGRLHRLNSLKKEVWVYDYVDIHVKMLEKMYAKRMRTYSKIGYQVKGEDLAKQDVNIIFNRDNFLPVWTQDIISAKREILILSPFVSAWRVKQMLPLLKSAVDKGIRVKLVTRPASDFENSEKLPIIFEEIKNNRIEVLFKSSIHQKFTIIDYRISWYGSLNLLSYGRSEESMMRIDSGHIAGQLARSVAL